MHSTGLQVSKNSQIPICCLLKENKNPKAVQTIGTKMTSMKKTISYKTSTAHHYKTYKQLLFSSVIVHFCFALFDLNRKNKSIYRP